VAGRQTRGPRGGDALDVGGERSTDVRARRAASRERDAPLEAAYKAGQRGDDPAEYQTSDELYGYYQDGAKAAKGEARQERGDQLRGDVAGKAGSVANDGAGFILGLIGYALLANYLSGGVPGVKAWFEAKFLNRVSGGDVAAKPTAAAKPAAPDPARAMRVGS
jgi:hypothetical protein